jgi:hypothetical protein
LSKTAASSKPQDLNDRSHSPQRWRLSARLVFSACVILVHILRGLCRVGCWACDKSGDCRTLRAGPGRGAEGFGDGALDASCGAKGVAAEATTLAPAVSAK